MGLTHNELVLLLVQLSLLLFFGRLFAEGARKLRQPAVAGELLAGIMLGPTLLGTYSPELYLTLFPVVGGNPIALNAFIQVSLVLLLFIAGLEVELHIVWQQGRSAFYTSFLGLVAPFILGFTAAYVFPDFFGNGDKEERLILSLFLGTSLAITALPVIARILMDLNLFKTNFGVLIIASAMITDLIGWMIFSVILSMLGQGHNVTLGYTILLTIGFTIFMLTIGKNLINKVLPWINQKFAWPGGLLSWSLSFCFLWAAFTEYIGIHAIFGAFIFGVALGQTIHFSERAKEIVHQFINNIFAPLFFVSIGLRVDFVQNFSLSLTLIILVLAFIGKIGGSGIGASLGGYSFRNSLAIGCGMNARGAMEIILGIIALEFNLINEKLFVALVIMAFVTSITSGPLMKYLYIHEELKPET
jgi:Kef-type K+ transport system membrane component KefB